MTIRLRCNWQMLASVCLAIVAGADCPLDRHAAAAPPAEGVIRFATYNVSLYRERSCQLVCDLEAGNSQQAARLAEVIQRTRPHVLLVNEFDYDAQGRALAAFERLYLARSQNGQPPICYRHRFFAAVNTGLPSGMDLNGDGIANGPDDAIGYGRHEGQYGMAVLSMLPIVESELRTFRNFLWKDMPGALLPLDPATGGPYYSPEALAVLRLSSKSHWDVPILVSAEPRRVVHFLCSHPTPPVFDGAEDRNGRRNHDEIRLLADYVDPLRAAYLVDDTDRRGGLDDGADFVIAGDLNADPVDGGARPAAIKQLLGHPRIDATRVPASRGAVVAAQTHAELNRDQRGDAAHDTADFSGDGHGNLRVDYVLPSHTLPVVGTGVFWPARDQPGAAAIEATDHRLVWLDVALPDAPHTRSNRPPSE